MLNKQQKFLVQALHISHAENLDAIRREIAGKYKGLDNYTVDVDGLRAFIKRLTKSTGQDEEWLNNILLFLGKKPVEKWSDADRSEAEVRLADFARRLLDLRKLQLHYDQKSSEIDGEFDVILLKALKKGAEPIDEVVAIDKTCHNAIQGVKEELSAVLAQHKDKDIQLAVLAELVDEFLIKYRDKEAVETKRRRGRPRKTINES